MANLFVFNNMYNRIISDNNIFHNKRIKNRLANIFDFISLYSEFYTFKIHRIILK